MERYFILGGPAADGLASVRRMRIDRVASKAPLVLLLLLPLFMLGSGCVAIRADSTDKGASVWALGWGADSSAQLANVAVTGPATNTTFVIRFQTASPLSEYGSSIVRTNTVGISGANRHAILDFGNITNNALSGADSVVTRFSLYRIATPDGGDIADDAIIVDSIDIHVPVCEYGSANLWGEN